MACFYFRRLPIITGMKSAREYSDACDANSAPILGILKDAFAACRTILEIGSGTGQHAVYFGKHLPHLTWQTSDVPGNHSSINAWHEEASLSNVLPAITLNVSGDDWPMTSYDGVFSANTTHIISRPSVIDMFSGIAKVLKPDGIFCLYGPFNYDGKFSSLSNERFDRWLKDRDPESGIRNKEDLDGLAADNAMILIADHEMPVNNRILVWKKEPARL